MSLENSLFQSQANMIIRDFKNEEFTEYGSEQNNIPCHILESGLTEVKSKFYICECDPERCNPICEQCFKNCHFNGEKEPHKEISSKEMSALCICGYKCHRPLNESEMRDKKYKPICTFGELASIPDLNFSYQDVDQPDIDICLVCYNICYGASEKLVKKSLGDLSGFKCGCKHQNHSDFRIIFRKLKDLGKGKTFMKDFNFEGMTFLHFINIVTSSKMSFNNLFHSFNDKINSIFRSIQQQIEYGFEEYNTMNNLHLTSQVLVYFAQKCKNEYKIKNKIEDKIEIKIEEKIEDKKNITTAVDSEEGENMEQENEKENENENNDNNNEKENDNEPEKEKENEDEKEKDPEKENDYKKENDKEKEVDIENEQENDKKGLDDNVEINGGKINSIKVTLKPLCYLNDVIAKILNDKIYFKIMERKFDCKSRNIWLLKYYLTSIFHKFYIQKDFTYYPNLKVRDIILLTPLQRLLMVSSIESETKVSKYVSDLNMNYLNKTLMSIESVISSQEKNVSLCLILAKLYKICLIFAKFSLFNHEQLSKLCSLNDVVLSLFEEEKPNREIDFLKLKVISCMVKILVFLTFYYNDQLIASALKGEKQMDKLKFYHGKTEISKNITTNVILIKTFMQRFENDVMEYQKKIEQKIIKKTESNNDSNNNMQDLPPKQHNIKCFRRVYRNCQIILNLSLCDDEEYNSGLVRLIDNEQIILFYYLNGALSQKQKYFLQRLKYYTEQLEDNYQFYFLGFNSQEKEEKFSQKYEDIITEFYKNFVTILDKNKTHTEEDEEIQMLKKDEVQDNESENGERKEDSTDYNHKKVSDLNYRNMINNSNKYLIIKTFFLQSAIKYIHVMFFSFYSRKNQPEKFCLKPQIFKKIMDILSNFVNSCPENSFFILQSDFTTNFELLNDDQLLQAIILINTALENIAKSKRDIVCEENLMHFIKVAILKSDKLEILAEILKAMCTLSLSVNCLHYDIVKKKTMKLCKIIFNYHKTLKKYFNLLTLSKEQDGLQYLQNDLETILQKYMTVINTLIDQKTIVKEKEFLDMLFTKEDLKKILYNMRTNIPLRTELINYYRKCFLETILDKTDINYFTSILINDNQPEKKDDIIENTKYFKFFEILVKSGDYDGQMDLEKDANVIKFELINFQEILKITSDKSEIKAYIESIVKCVVVHFAKFSSLFFDSNGFNCLSIYEIVYYFLALKQYIYTCTDIFHPQINDENKVLFKRKLNGKKNEKINLINPEEVNEEQQQREKRDSAKSFLIKEKKKISVPKNDAESVEYDLALLADENYEFFNFAKLRKVFLNHIKGFIQFPVVKNMKNFFERSQEITDEKIAKYKNYLRSIGRMKNKFDEDVLDIISEYTNSKSDIEKGSFIKVLDETNAHYNTTYRMLLCKSIPFFINSYNGKYKEDEIWSLFKLLQYNTTGIQESFIEMEEQNTTSIPVLDFNSVVQHFTSSIITVLLRGINYNGYENQQEYFHACLDIKLMKFFCEEHNTYFQSLFFNNSDSCKKDVLVRYKNRIKIRKQKKKI